MTERTPRQLQRPAAFWSMVAISTVVGLVAAALAWLKAGGA